MSIEDHARTKGMWAGSITRATIPSLYGMYCKTPRSGESADNLSNYYTQPIKRDHTPALLKMFDEVIVNATDHQKGCRSLEKEKKVTTIDISFDTKTGIFSCRNNGPGIPIVKHLDASQKAGRDVYIPEVAACTFLAGSNLVKPADCIKGGINGVGLKLAAVHSAEFLLETVDNSNGRHLKYVQSIQNQLKTIHPPTIWEIENGRNATRVCAISQTPPTMVGIASIGTIEPYTRITFEPSYQTLDYSAQDQTVLAEDYEDLDAWLLLRTCQAAAYVGPKVTVTYNQHNCPTNTAEALARTYLTDENYLTSPALILSGTLKASEPPYSSHPWEVVTVISPYIKKFGHLSIINGVVCSKGCHTTYMKKILNDAAETQIRRRLKTKERKTSLKETCGNMFLVIVGALPGADWTGQRKDELHLLESVLGPKGANYHFPPAFMTRVGTTLAECVLSAGRDKKASKEKTKFDKYTRARKAGGRYSDQCMLMAAEGDSALSLIRLGLTLGDKNPGGPSFDNCGMISLGGVIVNARKKVTEIHTVNGDPLLIQNDQLSNNKFLQALVDVLGLDYACKYETEEERKKLKYGAIVGCVDQDLDGCGKILGTLLSNFHLFWPNLIKAGYVKKFLTPVIRVYAKKSTTVPVQEFFYEAAFQRWIKEERNPEIYEIKYYKGLASHNDNEVYRMFKSFHSSLYTFTLDTAADKYFEIYFGPLAGLRKMVLATPVQYLKDEEMRLIQETREIPCEVHLNIDTKAYKLDAIERQIPNYVDGLTRARRKILAGVIKCFRRDNKDRRVFQVAGRVISSMLYHHGNVSLETSIINMVGSYRYGYHYPYLIGVGRFGDRHLGMKAAGSPRYVKVRIAAPFVNSLYPEADNYNLSYVFEDGERAEPKHFIPVLPVSILESGANPSEGWSYTTWARNLEQVVGLVKAYADEKHPLNGLVNRAVRIYNQEEGGRLEDTTLVEFHSSFPLDISTRNYSGEVRQYRGEPHSFGWYTFNETTLVITVTELPLRTITKNYIEMLTGETIAGRPNPRSAFIEIGKVDDFSTGTEIRIEIPVKSRAHYELILDLYGDSEIDPIEDFLLLRTSLRSHLNFVQPGGGVIEFGQDYHHIVCKWIPLRQQLYKQRLEREKTLIGLRILLEKEILRYIQDTKKIDFVSKADEQEAHKVLEQSNYRLIDANLLKSPGYISTADLEEKILHGTGASYDYILTLQEQELLKSKQKKRENKLIDLELHYNKTQQVLSETPFAGASLWLSEITNVEKAVATGLETNWTFE